MAFDPSTLDSMAVVVDPEVAKQRLADAPQREGGGWVEPTLRWFDETQQANEYVWLPLTSFPTRENAGPRKANTVAQNLNQKARDLNLSVKAKGLRNDEGVDGVILTHEYPEKSNRGRPAGVKNGEGKATSKSK